MSAEPYSGVPAVSPETIPAPPQRIQTDPGMFGGLVARGEQQLGAGAEQAGSAVMDYAQRQQNLFNEANVNAAQSKYLQSVTDALYKPESMPGAGDGGFYTKRGDQSLAAYGDAKAQIDKLRNDTLASLPNKRQQVMFDQLTRRLHDYSVQDMGRHVDQQIQQAADVKTQALLGSLGQSAALGGASSNPDLFDHLIDQGVGAAKSWGDRKGFGADWGNEYASKWVGQTVSNAAEQMAVSGDVLGASALVSKYENQMDKGSVLAVRTKLKGAVEDRAADTWARNVIYGAAPGAPDIGGISGRIQSIEGTAPNPGSTATGVGQFTNATWLDTVRSARPDMAAKPDADILKLRGDPAFASAMTTNYATQNARTLNDASLPGTPGNVYLAHFLGPTGAIKLLSADPSTPVESLVSSDAIKANPFLAGKSAADLKQWADLQMAGVKPGTAVKVDKAGTMAQAMTAFADNPDMQRKVSAAINREYAGVQLAAAADAQRQQQVNEAAANGYVQRLMKGDTKEIVSQIANDPALTYETRTHLWNMAEAHGAGELYKDVKTYGPGFYKLYQAVHAPEGDPSRITDPTQLYNHVGESGDLTVSGVDKLTAEIQGRRTPEGEAEGEMRKTFLANARGQITGANEGLHIRDPKGDELYLKFLAQALPSYDAGKKAGKSAAQLLDPASPDYVGKSIASFKRPMSQWVSDMLNDNAGIPAVPDTAAPDLSTPQALVAAVRNGKLGRAEGEALAVKNGWIQAPGPSAPAVH